MGEAPNLADPAGFRLGEPLTQLLSLALSHDLDEALGESEGGSDLRVGIP